MVRLLEIGCIVVAAVVFMATGGQLTTQHQVELVIVADYSTYKYWLDMLPAATPTNTRAHQAVTNIQTYAAALVKSANLAYATLQKYNLTVNLRLVNVLVMQTPEQAPWTEQIKTAGNPTYEVSASEAMSRFIPYSSSLQKTIPHDHAMILTRYKLFRTNKNGLTLGTAKFGQECKPRSVSIIVDDGFSTANVFAHELAHSLGSQHDGEGNACTGGYIMESILGRTANQWQFSHCSADYIKNFIHNLAASHNSCLEALQNHHQAAFVIHAKWFGQSFDPDTQCSIHLGPTSHFCRKDYNGNFTDVCGTFSCFAKFGNSSGSCFLPLVGAGDGTPCGINKWCMSNKCVAAPHNTYPHVDASCIGGDQPDPVHGGKRCHELVSEDPNHCNDKQIRTLCCDSCRHANTTSVPVNQQCAARFGAGSVVCRGTSAYNKDISSVMCKYLYCTDQKNPSYCHAQSTLDKTPCGDKKWCMNGQCVHSDEAPQGLNECPFPDEVDTRYNMTCHDVTKPQNQYLCYRNSVAAECCSVCHSLKRNKAGCEYGDKSSACHHNMPDESHKRFCYYGHNADICCDSCTAYRDATNPGCEYGDRISGCDARMCSRYTDSTHKSCCDTCKDTPQIVG